MHEKERICPGCAGSGEGMYASSFEPDDCAFEYRTCSHCRGTGFLRAVSLVRRAPADRGRAMRLAIEAVEKAFPTKGVRV